MDEFTRVGNDLLPELPHGWPVAVDTESSGLYPDGDPFASAGRPAQPKSRISVVSISFRWPVWNEKLGEFEPGEIRDYAWPFDQGAVIGKPGGPVKDEVTGACTFTPIDEVEQDRILKAMGKVLNKVLLPSDIWNWAAEHYENLIRWLDRRDKLVMHNSVHDMHHFRVGLRADAGGYGGPEGLHAWDVDSEPGQWRSGVQQRIELMEPTKRKLTEARRRREVHCTMITQKQLIDPIEVASLKPTSKRLWGEDEGDEQARLKGELAKMGTGMTKRYDLLMWGADPFTGQSELLEAYAAMGRYAAKDTNLTLRLFEYQMQCAEEGAVLPAFWDLLRDELELRTVLYRMERRGAGYNVSKSLAEGERLRAINEIERTKMPFDPGKPAQAKRFYFGPVCPNKGVEVNRDLPGGFFCTKDCEECGGKNGIGLEPLSRTATGLPQLDIMALHHLNEEGYPYAREYMEWTKRRNSDSKWYTGWALRAGEDGRIRTSYRQCATTLERPGQQAGGTKSGRLASTRVNTQQIPKDAMCPEGALSVRMLFEEEPGYVKYEHDLATGEFRVAVMLAGIDRLWDALDNGLDVHAMNAKALFAVDEDHPKFKMYRQAGKGATFCILYGGGVMALKDQLEAGTKQPVSMARAKQARESFFRAYPEFRRMAEQAAAKVERHNGGCGYLTMLDGWRRWYGLNERSNSAVNQSIQGNLARACNRWMREVEREIPGVLLWQIHDSLVTRHRDSEEGRAQAQLVSDIGNRVFEDYFKHPARGNRIMDFGIAPDLWLPK